MRCGVNLTSPRVVPYVQELLDNSSADFCEILIDNFLHLDPCQVRDVIGDVPIGFHIMWSRFMERDERELQFIARHVREWASYFNPIYISDHIAQFSFRERMLPLLAEVDYQQVFGHACERVSVWQQELGCRLLLENFPSTLDKDGGQVDFYRQLQNETGCGLLFDCSNAVIAQLNCGVDLSKWESLARSTTNYHIAGFRKTSGEPSIAIDTHDVLIEEQSFNALRSILEEKSKSEEEITVVVERDANIDVLTWKEELDSVRKIYGSIS
ncbi:MAG: DUF692 family protein [Candidatus Thiodiazotropha lotti]|nr:DUF692 family protein [Candidatus Thiodiazotropha lotti]